MSNKNQSFLQWLLNSGFSSKDIEMYVFNSDRDPELIELFICWMQNVDVNAAYIKGKKAVNV